ncbi:unnamed protein product [Strongylus vulgaris]|uniref:Uncharacterized protein n=1 Tax=Strongylus vulgaris TaxID=40348 RepID=A0A3P7K4Y3_STRVU|nr:unnamed protein product [Strongylus vulgaris]
MQLLHRLERNLLHPPQFVPLSIMVGVHMYQTGSGTAAILVI